MSHQAFMQAIIETPEDDVPRLVYSDWFEDNGDLERAEFIRTQVQLARLPPDASERATLVAREQALLQEHGKRWAEPLRGLDWGWRFERGFIGAIQIDSFKSYTVPDLARVVALIPVRMLSIFDDWIDGEALVTAAPLLKQLRELRIEYTNFNSYRMSDSLQTILTSPHVTRLTKLFVMGGRNWGWLSKKALRAIITSPSLTGLTDLTLIHHWHGLSGDLIRIIARSPRNAQLERLSLLESPMNPELMQELGSSRYLTRLSRLDFSMCRWERATWQALLDAPRFRQLERLYLYNTDVISPAGEHIANVGESICGRDHSWRPDEPLREALLSRFGHTVVDFTTAEVEPPCWEGWQKWEER
jgi:uncharacterized protein (TIGR02996 family)